MFSYLLYNCLYERPYRVPSLQMLNIKKKVRRRHTYRCIIYIYKSYIQSIWRHKDSTLGQQALERVDGDEEAQGRKALGIHRPCLDSVRAQRVLFPAAPLVIQALNFTRARHGPCACRTRGWSRCRRGPNNVFFFGSTPIAKGVD